MSGKRAIRKQAAEISTISGAKGIGKELNIPVVALSQLVAPLNRDRRPSTQLSDLPIRLN